MISIAHGTTCTGTNDPTKQVSKDAWNANHGITQDGQRMLGKPATGVGATEEMDATAVLAFSGAAAAGHGHAGVYEPANANIQTHVAQAHAPANAQKNSDILKSEIEAVLTGAITSHSHAGGGAAPAWKGVVVACVADGDPQTMFGRMLHNPVNATPTNIGLSVARCSYFKLDTAITVANIRFFGVGATTAVYHIAVYRNSDGARMSGDLNPNTAAQAWGVAASSFTLAADTLYFVAVGIDTVGTTAGILCCSGTTGRIGVLPTSWPGSLDIDAASPKVTPFGFAQFAVTNGALPATAPARAAQAAWTGGMPAIFMDSV